MGCQQQRVPVRGGRGGAGVWRDGGGGRRVQRGRGRRAEYDLALEKAAL